MGLPETGKAAKAIDGALEHIHAQGATIAQLRREVAKVETERASTDWLLMYVSELADELVDASRADRARFAHEIRTVIADKGITPAERTVARPADLEQPPAEGEWLIEPNIHVGED